LHHCAAIELRESVAQLPGRQRPRFQKVEDAAAAPIRQGLEYPFLPVHA